MFFADVLHFVLWRDSNRHLGLVMDTQVRGFPVICEADKELATASRIPHPRFPLTDAQQQQQVDSIK